MSCPILGYWNTRGIAERIRILLEHVDIKYENKVYEFGTEQADYKDNEWKDAKDGLELDFPNLPYFIDGNVRISESMAIMKYIARKSNLVPDSISDWAKAEMVENIVRDLIIEFGTVCYSKNFPADCEQFFESFPFKLAKIDNHLSKNKWVACEKLTYVDFCLGEILDHIRLLKSDVYESYVNIRKYLKNYDNLDSVLAHHRKSSYKALPINGPMSIWGGKK